MPITSLCDFKFAHYIKTRCRLYSFWKYGGEWTHKGAFVHT